MKSNFINNSEDVFSANEAQVKKIEFLTREKAKTDMYIKDLEESLRFNKEAVRAMNNEGPNDKTIKSLSDQNSYLHKRLQDYYEQNRDINALRLFEAQIRIQDRSFYNERVQQFENRISDLRKYLHDKEDSFTNVVNRLRKYEDISEMTIRQKLAEFKNDFGEVIHHQLIAQLSQERNTYKLKCQQLELSQRKLDIVEYAMKSKTNYEKMMKDLEKIGPNKNFEQVMDNIVPLKVEKEIKSRMKESTSTKSNTSQPNIELIRMLKKEKLSNQILEQTLNDAIEKNEQLLNLNDKLAQSNNELEQICRDLRSQILVLESRLSEFDDNYRRRVKDYSKCDIDKPSYKFSDFSNDITRKALLAKLQKDVNSMANFSTSTHMNPKCLNKSSSEPKIIGDTGLSQEDIQIQQY